MRSLSPTWSLTRHAPRSTCNYHQFHVSGNRRCGGARAADSNHDRRRQACHHHIYGFWAGERGAIGRVPRRLRAPMGSSPGSRRTSTRRPTRSCWYSTTASIMRPCSPPRWPSMPPPNRPRCRFPATMTKTEKWNSTISLSGRRTSAKRGHRLRLPMEMEMASSTRPTTPCGETLLAKQPARHPSPRSPSPPLWRRPLRH